MFVNPLYEILPLPAILRLPWEGGFGDMFDLDSLRNHRRSLAHQRRGRYTV